MGLPVTARMERAAPPRASPSSFVSITPVISSASLKRIAAGSGTQVVDVNRLLKQFEMVQQLSRQFASPGKKKGLLGKLKGMGGGMGLPF